jgi:Ca2+-binding RTX toxin-like protein
MATASALEQYMLELVNAERLRVGAQALAFDGALNQAADGHSAWMIASDTFSHTGSGGSTPTQRMIAAGFDFVGSWASAENIAWASTRGAAGFQDEVKLLHENLMASAGHRANILNGTYREIGIGFATGEYQSWDSAFVTQNFALTRTNPFLTGVAFDDRDGDHFYDPGEGLGGVAVTAVSGTGLRYTTTTTATGGYDLGLPAGAYNVTFSGGAFATVTRQVTIGSANVKLDLADPTGLGESGTAASETIHGTSGKDVIKGLAGNDRLYGDAGADLMSGGEGNDTLLGGAGNDRQYGGTGRDVLSGELGNDVLTGGLDADIFRFRGSWGADRVTDFQNGVDRIDLRWTGLSFGELSVTQRDMDGDGVIDDVLIRGNGQTVTLLNENASGIGASDFLL